MAASPLEMITARIERIAQGSELVDLAVQKRDYNLLALNLTESLKSCLMVALIQWRHGV